MKIRITKEDIKNGTPGSPCNCPIGLALQRSFKTDRFNVTVGYMTATVKDWVYQLPNKCYDFIINFDGKTGKRTKPFEFEIMERLRYKAWYKT